MLLPPKDEQMLQFVGGALAVPILIVYFLVVIVALSGLIWLILRRSNGPSESTNHVAGPVNSDVSN
jgi:hypothetical protein